MLEEAIFSANFTKVVKQTFEKFDSPDKKRALAKSLIERSKKMQPSYHVIVKGIVEKEIERSLTE